MILCRAVRSSPGMGRLIDQSDDAAKGSEIEVDSAHHSARSAGKKMLPLFSVIRMGSRGTFILWRLGSVTFKLFSAIDLQLCQLWSLPLKRSPPTSSQNHAAENGSKRAGALCHQLRVLAVETNTSRSLKNTKVEENSHNPAARR